MLSQFRLSGPVLFFAAQGERLAYVRYIQEYAQDFRKI